MFYLWKINMRRKQNWSREPHFSADLQSPCQLYGRAPKQRLLIRGVPCWAEMASLVPRLTESLTWGHSGRAWHWLESWDRSLSCCSRRLSARCALQRGTASSWNGVPPGLSQGAQCLACLCPRKSNLRWQIHFCTGPASTLTEGVERTIEGLGSIQKLSFIFRKTFCLTHRIFSL